MSIAITFSISRLLDRNGRAISRQTSLEAVMIWIDKYEGGELEQVPTDWQSGGSKAGWEVPFPPKGGRS